MLNKSKTLYLVDGSSYIYRAFYALTSLTNSKGEPVNAVFGFARMFITLLKKESPEYVAIAFDPRGKTFRHDRYPEYKANRPGMPEDLAVQIPYIKTLVKFLNVKSFTIDGVEADDVIGTIALKAVNQGFRVTIVSGDKDFMQLVSKDIEMLDTMKNRRVDIAGVKEKFGVEPERVVEVMGLTGDSSDNVPGVPGIGIKTAVKLVSEYGSIETVIKEASRISSKSVRNKIEQNVDIARLSRELVRIKTDVPIDSGIDALSRADFETGKLSVFLKEMGFNSIIRELDLPTAGSMALGATLKNEGSYFILKEKENLSQLLSEIKKSQSIALSVFENPPEVAFSFCGFSVTPKEGTGYLIPLEGEENQQLLKCLEPVLEDPKIFKSAHDMKVVLKFFKKRGVNLKGEFFDTMIASYLLRPTLRIHSLHELSSKYLEQEFSVKLQLTEQKDRDASVRELSGLSIYSDFIFYLHGKLTAILQKEGLYSLFKDVEMPVMEAISRMEDNGVLINPNALLTLSEKLKKDLAEIEKDIFVYAGEQFNVNSPKQLGEILFNKLNLKATKKTKTGFSTDNSVLESLSGVHPLPGKIVEYRQIMKIKSTYADALPKMINSETGRVHTSYNQTVTATGRLSSTEPNLQNIPIRSSLGSKIREAFIADEGWVLLSADYSQIELRILAHMSGDPALLDAFTKGEDIHQRTAAEVFQITPLLVAPEMRRMAKTINFGIIYGMGPHGLAKSLGRTRKEATLFLEKYFLRYSRVKSFIETSISDARSKGFVETLFDRRRSIPDLNSSNRNLREMAERIAVNTRIQGTAADILKVAMVNIHRRLEQASLESKMIMQVHDELVFEVLKSEITVIKDIVKSEMEGVISLSVPLTVDISTGTNWDKDSVE